MFYLPRMILLTWVVLLCVSQATAQVVINEFVASNGSTASDEDDAFVDWIELYNGGTDPVDLSGWGLSDEPTERFKWQFPAGATIQAGEHLLVWASGKDRIAGEDMPGIIQETWFGIPGSTVADLTSHPSYAYAPASRTVFTEFVEGPSGWRKEYGQRLHGLIIPPATGDYRFWIASDDNSELRLSSDEAPANSVVIASVDGYAGFREWDKFPSQQSGLINLQEGERYYIEVLMKQNDGGDNLSVRWQLPDGTMEEPMSATHIVQAKATGYHTNFSLSASGEPLLLTRSNGTIADQVSGASLPRDVSFGRLTSGGSSWHYFGETTPGGANDSVPKLLPPSVSISEPRGFRDQPFEVTLQASDPAATIRYTLDGSTPGPDSTVYTGPIEISGTSTLRAAVVEPDLLNLPPTTATWLFLDDILTQSSTPPTGWPANREINNHLMLYGLRDTIVDGDNLELRQGMKEIPSLSIVTDLENLFGADSGIYAYSNQSFGWERSASVELIDPNGNTEKQFQIDIGLRLRGAYSRLVDNPKHSFRFFFRSPDGERELKFPLFGEEGTNSFKKVDLRTAQNYSWSFQRHPDNTFVREVFSRDTQRDMGMPYTRSRYYHLYINGLYWGLYMTQERGDNDWAETYLGGSPDEWDYIKTGQPGYVTTASDGNNDAWYAMHDMSVNEGFSGAFADNYWRIRGLNPDGSPNPEYPAYLDQDNLIEYMLISHYTGDNDSPVSISGNPNNINALFNRVNPFGFTWLRHDAEHSLGARNGVYLDTTDLGVTETSRDRFNPAVLHWKLSAHPDYRMRMADLMQRHVFGAGPLTPSNAKARFQSRMSEINYAIIGESARWGQGYTRDSWINACNDVLDYLDLRRDIVVAQYRSRGWFPSIDAPQMNVTGTHVRLDSPIPFYYMSDGSDPRLPGGGIHPDATLAGDALVGESAEVIPRDATWHYYDAGSEPADVNGLPWTHPDYAVGAWSSGPALLGFAGSSPQNVVATETDRWVSGTSGPQVTTTYFRHEFTLDSVDNELSAMIEVLRDDGAVIYLNGVEILRENMPGGSVSYDTYASTYDSDFHTTWFTRQPDVAGLLRSGVNVLAAEVHQVNASSSDKYFGLSLTLTSPPEPVEFPIHQATAIRARAYVNGEWSALSDGSFIEGLPEPVAIHRWDHEDASHFLEPSYTVGGAALDFFPGPVTDVERHPDAAEDFQSAHLRVNNPLGASLVWSLPSTGVGGLRLSWETRRSGEGAGTHHVEITTDGLTWSPLETYTVRDAVPQVRSFDLTGIEGTEDNPDLAVRVSFAQGQGGTVGNNRFDNVVLKGVLLPDLQGAEAIVFDSVPSSAQSGAALGRVSVRAQDADGNTALGFNGPVSLSLLGDGTLSGTLTVNAVNGVATFDDLVITGAGEAQLSAATGNLDSITSDRIQSIALTGLVVPRYIQGEQDAFGDNNTRVPFAWRARIDGLRANATYRFANRVVVPGDAPDADGAGNMIFATGPTENWIRSTASPSFYAANFGTGHFTFTTDASGSYTGWFLTEPSGNARFTPGNQVRFRLLLNDGAGGVQQSHHLTTSESATVIAFGSGPEQGTAIIGDSSHAARRLVVLYPDTEGAARPLAATPIEISGAGTDARYATFYQTSVATKLSHWGTILPNTLPGGVRRVEVYAGGGNTALLDAYVNPSGYAMTPDPAGGLTAPVSLDTDGGQPVFLAEGSAVWHDTGHWDSGTIPNAPGATAIFDAPAWVDRDVDLDLTTTIGTLRFNQEATDFFTRLGTATRAGSLTFDGGAFGATLRVDGNGGSGHVAIDCNNPVTLAEDLSLLVNQTDGGDPEQGALLLKNEWSGPGGLIKQGPGLASLSGEGKLFTGALVVEQGALRVSDSAVPEAASGVTVYPGGQLRLFSIGSATEPSVHSFGGGALEIGGTGRGGSLPLGQGYGLQGALRYDPEGSGNLAVLSNALELSSDAHVYVDGVGNTLRLEGAITANGNRLVKSGEGELVLSAASPPLEAPSIYVEAGTLSIDVLHPAGITLGFGTVLSGSGQVDAVSGVGMIALDDERLTAAQSTAMGISALLTTPGDSPNNGGLILTSQLSPLPIAPQSIDLYLAPSSNPVPGDRFRGGLVVPENFDLTAALAGTAVNLFVADPTGDVAYLGENYRAAITADELSWSVSGRTLEVLQEGTPTSYEQWRGLQFADAEDSSDDAISGPEATGDDGMANLVRYAFNLDLDDPIGAVMPELDRESGRFLFTHDPEKSDVAWVVRSSTDLLDWSNVLFDSRMHSLPEPDPDGRIGIPYPAEFPSLFLRLDLSLQP
jgi:autotransporter-associated beta strand protein